MARRNVISRADTEVMDSLLRETRALQRQRRARAKRLIAHIQSLLEQRARIAHDIGRDLAALRDERLYLALDTRTFGAVLEQSGLGRSQAYKLIAVVGKLDAHAASAIGVEAAYRSTRARSKRPRAGKR